jgi:2-oxoisovalerate ferredoxin oxidoreductase beta subunit
MPMGMCEIMNALETPVYIERVSLADSAGVMRTRKAVSKGLKNQMEKKGFSFIEVLSPCPINWKMDPVSARRWITDVLESKYPVKKFRDADMLDAETSQARLPELDDTQLLELLEGGISLPEVRKDHSGFTQQRIKIAGFGGQGVLSAGVLLSQSAISEGLESSWLPSYGPEMRGGHANASVIISEENIGSPVVDDPTVLIAMNGPSLDLFEDAVESGGWIFVNSSVVERKVRRSDVHVCYVPATDIAKKEKILAAANIVMVSACLYHTHLLDITSLDAVIPLSVKRKEHIELNRRLIEQTITYLERGES